MRKEKKEEEEAMSTSPKRKTNDVPIVDSNNAEEVNRLTEMKGIWFVETR